MHYEQSAFACPNRWPWASRSSKSARWPSMAGWPFMSGQISIATAPERRTAYFGLLIYFSFFFIFCQYYYRLCSTETISVVRGKGATNFVEQCWKRTSCRVHEPDRREEINFHANLLTVARFPKAIWKNLKVVQVEEGAAFRELRRSAFLAICEL